MKQLSALSILVLATMWLIAACGGGQSDSGPEPVSFDVTGLDTFQYEPADLTVPANAQVTVNLENPGVLEHSWVLVSDRVAIEDARIEDAIGGALISNVPGGENGNVTFTAPPPGTYQIICTVPGHALGGMVGTFTVTP